MSETELPDFDEYMILSSVDVETRDELDESVERVEQYVDTLDSERPVRTSVTFDACSDCCNQNQTDSCPKDNCNGATYHLNQVVIESVDEDVSALFDDDQIEWIVVGLDGGLKLATPDFSDTTFIPEFRVDSDEYVPKTENGIPHWGY